MILRIVALVLWVLAIAMLLVIAAPVRANSAHCPNEGGWWFSPVAPPSVCAPYVVHQVPEPGSLVLVLVGLVALRVVRRLR